MKNCVKQKNFTCQNWYPDKFLNTMDKSNVFIKLDVNDVAVFLPLMVKL